MKPEQLIETLVCVLPYPDQIKDLEILSRDTNDPEIRFRWRSKRYRLTSHLSVQSIDGGLLAGCDNSILIEALLRRHKPTKSEPWVELTPDAAAKPTAP
jgi:hypothetical protein